MLKSILNTISDLVPSVTRQHLINCPIIYYSFLFHQECQAIVFFISEILKQNAAVIDAAVWSPLLLSYKMSFDLAFYGTSPNPHVCAHIATKNGSMGLFSDLTLLESHPSLRDG